MIWLRQFFCKHEFKIIEDLEWVKPSMCSDSAYHETRKYMYCSHCGYKRKISNR